MSTLGLAFMSAPLSLAYRNLAAHNVQMDQIHHSNQILCECTTDSPAYRLVPLHFFWAYDI